MPNSNQIAHTNYISRHRWNKIPRHKIYNAKPLVARAPPHGEVARQTSTECLLVFYLARINPSINTLRALECG